MLLWKDKWIAHKTLQELFPHLYALESRKTCFISEMREGGVFKWEWKSTPNSDPANQELVDLNLILCDYNFLQEHDKFRCKLNPDGEYTLKALRRLVDSKITNIGGEPFIWLQIVPTKVSSFVWRMKQGRILVAVELSKRGVQTDSRIYKLCNIGEESADHLLMSCAFASEVIKRTLNQCGIRQVQFTKVKELLDFGARWGN
ncbi:unnamed protein product [Lactuca virosa]|uniref:Reverse transcriptase zinc-binding domain-containing protein n=1 Tax=Lactuca virosa TaxID=75947 RepID=A0AAU9PJ37_9ASTR|nr:unnamed protein product [Lactuca virosa]